METWSFYRANVVGQVIGFGGIIAFLAASRLPSFDLTLWIERNLPLAASMFMLLTFLMIVPTLNLINWKCPRCGQLFSYPAPDRSACQHCGLPKFGDPRAQ